MATCVFLGLYVFRNSNKSLLGVSTGASLVITALIVFVALSIQLVPSITSASMLAGISLVLVCLAVMFIYTSAHVRITHYAPSKLLTLGIMMPLIPIALLMLNDQLVTVTQNASGCREFVFGIGFYIVAAYVLWIILAHVYLLVYSLVNKTTKSVFQTLFSVISSLAAIALLMVLAVHSQIPSYYIFVPLYLYAIAISYSALSTGSANSKLIQSGILSPLVVVVLTSFVFIDDVHLAQGIVVVACVLVLFVGYILDRAMRKQSEYEAVLRSQNRELSELNRNKNEFLSFATHQLKAPLTSIKWGMGALKEGKLDTNQEMIVGQIIIVTNQMMRTVSDFLNAAKLEAGQLSLSTTPVELSVLVQKVINEFRPIARSKKVDIKGVFPRTRMLVDIDEVKMEQVLANIIDNALKYTPAGMVTVLLEKQNSDTVVVVRDTGAGMEQGEIESLFQKFQRGSAATLNSGGSGIGLYLSKQIVELHGGSLTATSAGKDKGSEFTIRIPFR